MFPVQDVYNGEVVGSLVMNECENFMDKSRFSEIVRCKDCAHRIKCKVNKKGFLICSASGMEITENDFCSYGERMENHDTK